MPLKPAAPDVPPEEEPGSVREILGEIDEELARERERDETPAPARVPTFRRGARTPESEPTHEGEPAGQTVQDRDARPAADGIDGGLPSVATFIPFSNEWYEEREPDADPFHYLEWVRAKHRKYHDLLSVMASPDFIDHDAANTLMAQYGTICLEVSRERRLYKDRFEDAQEEFSEWWADRLAEARADLPSKVTDKAVEAKARESHKDERTRRLKAVTDARRRAELLATFKNMIHNMKGVVQALGHALAFEWHTTGGLTVEEDGVRFRFSPARRTGKRPPPDALMRARARHREQT